MRSIHPIVWSALLRCSRFRLRTLLLFITGLACLLGWYVIQRDILRAQREYDMADYELELGRILHDDLCEASVALRTAECRMPFYSKRAAGAEHLARIQRLKISVISEKGYSYCGAPDAPARILDVLDRYGDEAEQWLEEHR